MAVEAGAVWIRPVLFVILLVAYWCRYIHEKYTAHTGKYIIHNNVDLWSI